MVRVQFPWEQKCSELIRQYQFIKNLFLINSFNGIVWWFFFCVFCIFYLTYYWKGDLMYPDFAGIVQSRSSNLIPFSLLVFWDIDTVNKDKLLLDKYLLNHNEGFLRKTDVFQLDFPSIIEFFNGRRGNGRNQSKYIFGVLD